MAHFDILVQHTAGKNLKFTDFLSRNPVENASPEEVYDEEYVINILAELKQFNLKYGSAYTENRTSPLDGANDMRNDSTEEMNQSEKSMQTRTPKSMNKLDVNHSSVKTIAENSKINSEKYFTEMNDRNDRRKLRLGSRWRNYGHHCETGSEPGNEKASGAEKRTHEAGDRETKI